MNQTWVGIGVGAACIVGMACGADSVAQEQGDSSVRGDAAMEQTAPAPSDAGELDGDADSPDLPDAQASAVDDTTDDASAPPQMPSDGCSLKLPSCNYVSATDPAGISLRDDDSFRSEAGYWCARSGSSTWVRTALCAYTESCEQKSSGSQSAASCVACGADGRERATRRIDGALVEDCLGCKCYGWSVYGCYTDPKTYGEAWVDVVFQRDSAVRRYSITKTGLVAWPAGAKSTVKVTNPQMDVRLGGIVEFDVDVDEEVTDSYQAKHRWQMSAHVVHICK